MPHPAVTGFFGKIPSRGDFVRHGLPGATVAALDSWCQAVLPGSRAALGSRWVPAWMEAPIWRFLLPAGSCGPSALAGVWLPSTDRAGRLFPLMLLRAAPDWSSLMASAALLDGFEAAGLAALDQDLTPEALNSALADLTPGGDRFAEPERGRWWSTGGPFVQPARHSAAGMPDSDLFAAMLHDRA